MLAISTPNLMGPAVDVQEVSSLGSTIKKRREELQEVTHTNAVEMDSIKMKAAEAISKAKDEHEKKVLLIITTILIPRPSSTQSNGSINDISEFLRMINGMF